MKSPRAMTHRYRVRMPHGAAGVKSPPRVNQLSASLEPIHPHTPPPGRNEASRVPHRPHPKGAKSGMVQAESRAPRKTQKSNMKESLSPHL